MDMNRVFATFLVLFSVCSVSVLSDSLYIVTSPENHCRRELTAEEPCLTLQQYAYNPSLGSNSSVSLTVESGTHILQGVGIKFNSESAVGISTTDFNMTGESTRVVYGTFRGHYYSPIMSIRNARYVTIRGVTFVSNNKGFVKIENVQQVLLEHCTFQGVRLYLNNIFDNGYYYGNVVISKSSFSGYSHQSYGYDSDRDYGAISVSHSIVYIIQSNFSANKGAVHYHDSGNSDPGLLVIEDSIFSNNTSKYGGSAVHVDGLASVFVNNSVFLFNSASGSGGAIHFSGKSNSVEFYIKASTFVYNNANFCGAINIEKYSKFVRINDSTFYYNRAVNIGGVGGAVCVRNASILISNSTFVANTASGDAGALQVEESKVTISSSIFSNNSARRDGGALFTSAHPSDYTITNCIFTHNKAGDDGGAVFIGRKGSHLKAGRSTFFHNHASDRGGAMAVFGSTLDITRTNVYSNLAHMGKAISACNSFVNTFISGQRDPDFPTCTIYDADIAPSNAPAFRDGSYSDVTWINNTVNKILTAYLIVGTKSDNQPSTTAMVSVVNASDSQKIRQTSIISYASLTISATLVIVLLLYAIISKLKATHCKIRRKKRGYRLLPSFPEQSESDDEELLDHNK